MQQPVPQQQELDSAPNPLRDSLTLADRLDPAIGEATSVMGAVMTELMRRSLRSGVIRIGDELNSFVGEQVDLAIADRTPALEELANTVADKAARLAATEVAAEEVHALEQRTAETGRQLTVQIEASREAARQSTAEAARDLTARIAEAEKYAHEKTQASAQELTGRIEETEKRVGEDAHATRSERARDLAQQIEAAEKRVETTVRTDFSSRIQELIQRSRESGERLKARFSALERNHGELNNQIAALLQAYEALSARVVELEKPRGLRALFLWLFGRRKKAATAGEAPVST